MRRTLAVLVATTAFLVPASAASADNGQHDSGRANASCSNDKGGNGARYNHLGNQGKARDCLRPAYVGAV